MSDLEDFLKEIKSPLLGNIEQQEEVEEVGQNGGENEIRMVSEEQDGQETIENLQNESGSSTKTQASGILQTQEEVVTEEHKAVSKKKIDLLDFIENNKDVFTSYLTEKNTDYNSLSDADAVKIKMKKDNPELTDKQISLLLEDKYGVGLDIIEIDEDTMSPDEIREYKRTNKSIEAGLAKLAIDAKSAKNYLGKIKEDIKLPEFELEVEDVDTDKIFQEKYKQLVEQETERVEKEVRPTLYSGVKSVESINVTYEYEDNGGKVALPLSYKLTDEDKEVIVNSLIYRAGKESDSQYVKSDGSLDFQKLLNDEGKYYLNEKLTKAAIKEAVTQVRKNILKDKMVNYQEAPRNIPNEDDQKHPSLAILDMLR